MKHSGRQIGGILELDAPQTSPRTLQIAVQTTPALFGGQHPTVRVAPGLTTLVGPNGAGKTQVLRKLKDQISGHLAQTPAKKVRYLSAGRASPLERFRASVGGPDSRINTPAYVGHQNHRQSWAEYESLTGDLLALEQRADLRLKVQARLQTFLSRSIQLAWVQNGLEVRMVPLGTGEPYPANDEASGILQLAPLLAAIYNDEIGALLIDEPEVSLHPQYQAFILQELEAVAGDPLVEPGKKFVVIATHSPSMLSVRSADDLPKLVFFNDPTALPLQIAQDAGEMWAKELRALVARLSATHRLAFFARNVLLVEGPSDEIIAAQLARKLKHPVLPANTQIVPVIGKEELGPAIRLFDLIGKRVTVLADLDALSDDPTLVKAFSARPNAGGPAHVTGHSSLFDMDAPIRNDFAAAVDKHWPTIEAVAGAHRYWAACAPEKRSDKTKRRATLATLMSGDGSELDRASQSTDFSALRQRFVALFDALEQVGCFILRKGRIEDYYQSGAGTGDKTEVAAQEAASFEARSAEELEGAYADVMRALRAAAPVRPVDENALLRERLGAALGHAFEFLTPDMPSEQINGRIRVAQPELALFELENCSKLSELRLRVKMNSTLFPRETLPFEISKNEDRSTAIGRHLPSA